MKSANWHFKFDLHVPEIKSNMPYLVRNFNRDIFGQFEDPQTFHKF